jgi:hypothetical protein
MWLQYADSNHSAPYYQLSAIFGSILTQDERQLDKY